MSPTRDGSAKRFNTSSMILSSNRHSASTTLCQPLRDPEIVTKPTIAALWSAVYQQHEKGYRLPAGPRCQHVPHDYLHRYVIFPNHAFSSVVAVFFYYLVPGTWYLIFSFFCSNGRFLSSIFSQVPSPMGVYSYNKRNSYVCTTMTENTITVWSWHQSSTRAYISVQTGTVKSVLGQSVCSTFRKKPT